MYRLVDCDTWSDAWFEGLEPKGKLFFLYLLTNPRSTSCGAFEITPRKMAFETGIDQEDIERWLGEWAPRVMWWPEHQIVFVKNFYRRQFNSEKVKINAMRLVAELPAEVRHAVYEAYPDWRPDGDTLSATEEAENSLSIPYVDPSHKQNETETETKQDGDATEIDLGADAPAPVARKPAKRATAIDPDWDTTVDLWQWALDEGYTPDELRREIKKFRDHFTANGKPMRDWGAAFRNWMRRSREFSAGPARASPATNGTRGSDPDAFFSLAEEFRQESRS